MQTQIRHKKPFRMRFWKASRVPARICPSCRARYEGIGCLQCGWVADTSVACCGSEALHEGKAIA